MNRLVIYISSALSLTMAGCGTCEYPRMEQPREQVELIVSVGKEQARVGFDGKTPESGDAFRFFFNLTKPDSEAVNPLSEGNLDTDTKRRDFKYTAGKWGTDTPIYWDDYQAADRDFCAIMLFGNPKTFGNYVIPLLDTDPHTFSVEHDQSDANGNGYRRSDLMLARVKTAKRLIPVTFQHMMARLIVNVSASTDPAKENHFLDSDISAIEVQINDVRTACEVIYGDDPGENDHKISTLPAGTKKSVYLWNYDKKIYRNSTAKTISASFTAILPPQTILYIPTDKGVLLTITLTNSDDQKKQYYLELDKNVVFEQGSNTKATVTLQKNGIVVDDGITLIPWEEDSVKDDDNIIELK